MSTARVGIEPSDEKVVKFGELQPDGSVVNKPTPPKPAA